MEAIFKEPTPSLSEKWAALPQAARIGVYAGGAALAALAILAVLFYFFRQRRRGAREADAAGHEMAGLGPKGGAWKPGDAEYTVAEVRGDGSVEKVFGGMGPRPDNSWPEEAHAAPLLGGGGTGPYEGRGYGYGPQSPPRSASAVPQGYGQQSPPLEYGYGHAGGYR